jgi:large subunit ribosomal protein L18
MINKPSRSKLRKKKHMKIRKRLIGTPERPRLCVFRSNKHIYAQIVDDAKATTLAAASTKEPGIATSLEKTSNIEAAKTVGAAIGKKAKDAGITQVVFDRGGYIFSGKVKALADAARESGLEF